MASLMQDFRYGLRTLLRNPGFSLMAVAAMALGIGANTAIFSVVNGILFHTLPYENDQNLVMLWEDASPRGGTDRVAVAPGNFLDWRKANPAFTDLAAIRNESLRLTSLEEPLVPLLHAVTPNYFDLIGAKPLLGRGFLPGEDRPGNERVVMISYGLWQKVLGGDPNVVDQPLELDHQAYTIVGIMPSDFFSIHQFGVQPDLWAPLVLDGAENDRKDKRLVVYGRLRDDMSLSEAQAAMSTVAQSLSEEHPETNAGWGIRIIPIRDDAVGRARPILTFLLAAVGFVLLVACANVANLTLARATERTQEIALRRALGASRWRINRQLITESVVLSSLGGLSGLFLAAWGLQPLLQLAPPGLPVPFLDDVSLDGRVLVFTLVLSVLTGVLFGLAPARHAARSDLNDPLKQGGRGPSLSRGSRRFGDVLVVVEIALALVLMAGAGLMIQSFRNLKEHDPGFHPEPVLTLRNSLRGEEYQEPHQRITYFRELVDRLEALSGVESASAVSFIPPLLPFQAATFSIPGETVEPGHEPGATVRVVLPDYFRTMGITQIQGRPINANDREDAPLVAVINETLARRYFSDRDPIGRYLILESSAQPEVSAERVERQVVGIVGDVRSVGPNPESLPVIYIPHPQAPLPIMNLVVKARGNPEDLLRAAERTAWGMGGDINVYSVQTLSERLTTLDWAFQASTFLLGAFAALALVLGAAGIYAVISYTVAKRTHEIGVRMALGAERGEVLRRVLTNGMKLTVFGIGLGFLASLGLARLIERLLYGVGTYDLLTFASVSIVLVGVAAGACFIPAYRASRVDPIVALRYE